MILGAAGLTEAEKSEFRQMWDSGAPVASIARRFGKSETIMKVWRDRLGCTPRRPPNAGKRFEFELSEEEIYAQAAEIRANWPEWRSPLYACSTAKMQERERLAAGVMGHSTSVVGYPASNKERQR
jgi:transposase-like protein